VAADLYSDLAAPDPISSSRALLFKKSDLVQDEGDHAVILRSMIECHNRSEAAGERDNIEVTGQ
jgi:hypothetical protein